MAAYLSREYAKSVEHLARWAESPEDDPPELRRLATTVAVGPHSWQAEFTLTSRDDMLFRMLLGRTAIAGKATVDPARSYLVGKKRRKKTKKGR